MTLKHSCTTLLKNDFRLPNGNSIWLISWVLSLLFSKFQLWCLLRSWFHPISFWFACLNNFKLNKGMAWMWLRGRLKSIEEVSAVLFFFKWSHVHSRILHQFLSRLFVGLNVEVKHLLSGFKLWLCLEFRNKACVFGVWNTSFRNGSAANWFHSDDRNVSYVLYEIVWVGSDLALLLFDFGV